MSAHAFDKLAWHVNCHLNKDVNVLVCFIDLSSPRDELHFAFLYCCSCHCTSLAHQLTIPVELIREQLHLEQQLALLVAILRKVYLAACCSLAGHLTGAAVAALGPVACFVTLEAATGYTLR